MSSARRKPAPHSSTQKQQLSLRASLWAVPALIAAIGIAFTLFEHFRNINDPIWPWPTLIGILVLGIMGPLLSWMVLRRATQAMEAYFDSQERLAERAEELNILNKLSVAASRSLDLEKTIATILEQTMETLDAEAGMVFIQSENEPELRLEAYRGISVAMAQREQRLNPGHCLCGQAADARAVLFADDVGNDPRCTSDLCICEGFRSVACVPLEVKAELVGLLQLASPETAHFTSEHTEFLEATANQVSVSIENARLYDRVQEFNIELERRINQRTRELEAARWSLAEKARQLQRLLSESYRVQEDTQARIAQDMHDSVTQTIIGAIYETQAARQALQDNPDLAMQNLARAQELLEDVNVDIRRAIYDLHPPVLDLMGLVVAIKRFTGTYGRTFDLPCDVQVVGDAARLPREVEIAFFRIIQAALYNIVAHAQAGKARVRFDFSETAFRVSIEDDGCGFDPQAIFSAPGDHLGLIGMKERAEGIKARLEVQSQNGTGSRVEAVLPNPDYLEPGTS